MSIVPKQTAGEAGLKARAPKHTAAGGLTAGPLVLPSESQAVFDELKESYYQQYRPANAVERDLVDEIVESRWRLRRLAKMEAAIFKQAYEQQLERLGEHADPDDVTSHALVDVAENSKAWRMVERCQRTLRRSYERARTELAALAEEGDWDTLTIDEEVGAARRPRTDYRAVLADTELLRVALPHLAHKQPVPKLPDIPKAA